MQSIDLVPNLVRGYDRRNLLAGNGERQMTECEEMPSKGNTPWSHRCAAFVKYWNVQIGCCHNNCCASDVSACVCVYFFHYPDESETSFICISISLACVSIVRCAYSFVSLLCFAWLLLPAVGWLCVFVFVPVQFSSKNDLSNALR